MPTREATKRRQWEESHRLMGDHGTGITDGLAGVERLPNGHLLVDVDGIKFEMATGVGEELLASLTRALRPFAGFSIFDEIMMNLDAVIDRLMGGDETEDGRDPGRAEAFTMALAIIRNPHSPDFVAEKARQMERWRQRESGEHESEMYRIDHKRDNSSYGHEGFIPED